MPTSHRKQAILIFLGSLKPSFKLFQKNDPLRLAGATAFFTTFALPPIIFLLANLFGLFIGRKNMGRGLLEHVSNILGEDGAAQVRGVIRSIRGFDDSWYVIMFGFLFLFFVATTLFIVIKNSLDQVWNLHIKDKPGFLFMLNSRLRSFAVIVVVGILFFADMLLESVESIAGNYIDEVWQGSGVYFKGIVNELVSIIVIASWFIVLFRFLADGRPVWKACIAGGLLTGVLFAIGRLVLGVLLVDSNIGQLYGPAGSLVLVLLFVFYSSFILYYGACFICVYSDKNHWRIKPHKMVLMPEEKPLAEAITTGS